MSEFPYRGVTDLRHERGGFDVIGDVHGCCDELEALLRRLGYGVAWHGAGESRAVRVTPPPDRRAVFVGDLVDRGPRSPDVLRIVMSMHRAGSAFAVPGNHDHKLRRWLDGRVKHLSHGLDRTVQQLEGEAPAFLAGLTPFLESLPPFVWLDGGRLAVAHAGILEHMLTAPLTGAIHRFCIFGDTDGQVDANGLAIRFDWTPRYGGDCEIVYGHTPVAQPERRGRTLCIDTGCCFGGALTALRWPQMEMICEPARATYWQAARSPGLPPPRGGAPA